MNQKKKAAGYLAGLLLLILGILLIAPNILRRDRFGVLDTSILVDVPEDEVPEGALYITSERWQFRRGDMTLIIPSINVFTPIGESTEPEYLKEMPGLYEFAQLPGESDVNTSIAGHRDIYDMVFYWLDRVKEGDYLYLLYQDRVYRYQFDSARVVPPDRWDVIAPQGFSSLTLTTCDPIGTTLNRLIVRGRLVDWQEFSEDYCFIASEEEAGNKLET